MGSGKNKIPNRMNYISRIEYNLFKEKYPESTITYEQFISVLKTSTIKIRSHILENPLGFKLPFLGYVAFKKFKTSKKFFAVDWINTLKLKKRVPLTNFHTFGHAFKLEFFKNPSIKPLMAYKLKAHRLLNRMSGQIIKSGKAPYIELDRNYFSKRFNIENYINKK